MVAIGEDTVFVDIGTKAEGRIDRHTLTDEHGKLRVALGDKIRATVIDPGGRTAPQLAVQLGRGNIDVSTLQFALEGGTPVEGDISKAVKGGVEVMVGSVRAFCPASQLEIGPSGELENWVGQKHFFRVIEIRDGGRSVVVSRRALLQAEREQRAAALLTKLEVGAELDGIVQTVQPYGVFVDLGGIEGLVPLRELSHDRLRPEDVVQLGDVLEVQIKDIAKKTDAKGREKTEITLSLKALAKDPWENIEVIAPVGKVVAGQVTRLADFGAFVRIGSGVEGLLHVSELGARVKRPEEALTIGQSLLVKVQSVDTTKKRVSLGLASEGLGVGAVDTTKAVVVGSIVKALVEKVETYGVVVQLQGIKGRSGRATVPNAETNTRPGTDLRKEFPVGKEITAKVLEASDNRVRLSIKAALDDAERADFDNFRATSNAAGMGTLGDLLKSKLGKK